MRRNARIRTWTVLTAVTVAAVVPLAFAGPALAGGGCHEGLTDATGTKVDLTQLCFAPTVIRVAAGGTVTWTNRDDTPHTVTGVGGDWGAYDELRKGGTVAYRFDRSGVFPYFCVIHPGMVGSVVVGNGRSASTTSQAAVAVLPPTTAPPSAAAEPAAAPAASETAGSTGGWDAWRTVAFAAALALVAAGTLIAVRRHGAAAEPEHPVA